jgi:hypothetical protein
MIKALWHRKAWIARPEDTIIIQSPHDSDGYRCNAILPEKPRYGL